MNHYRTDGYPLILSGFERALQLDRAYVASTGKVAIAVSGNMRVSFQNTSSLRTVGVAALALTNSSANMAWAALQHTPTTGLPGVYANHQKLLVTPANAGGHTSFGKLKFDTDGTVPLSGGTFLYELPLPPQRRTLYPMPMILAPSTFLGFNLRFLIPTDAELSLYFYEE